MSAAAPPKPTQEDHTVHKLHPLALCLAGIAAAWTAGCIAPWTYGGARGGATADQRFLAQAAREGMTEVKLGELAADHSADPRVKSLARQMLDDFARTNEQLRQLAAAKGVALPAGLDQREEWDYRALARLAGGDYEFNRYYVNMMAEYHVADVRYFRWAAKHTADPDIRRFAAANLRVLKDHREMAQTLVPQFGIGRTWGGDSPQ